MTETTWAAEPGWALLWLGLAVTSVILLIMETQPSNLADKVGAPVLTVLEASLQRTCAQRMSFPENCVLQSSFSLLL